MESLLIVYSRTWYFRKYTGARQVGFAFLNSLTSLLLCVHTLHMLVGFLVLCDRDLPGTVGLQLEFEF